MTKRMGKVGAGGGCLNNCLIINDDIHTRLSLHFYLLISRLILQKLPSISHMFRLDFASLVLAQPETVDNKCIYDQFIISGGNTIPAICGTNTGLHSKDCIYTQYHVNKTG